MAEATRELKVLLWHVHGSWMSSFVHGPRRYLLHALVQGPWGRGLTGRAWPDRAVEVAPHHLPAADIDVVVLQRPEELELVERWLHRTPGRDLPAIYLEHNAPRGPAATTRHPLADRSDIPIVQVTHFNDLMWDCGLAPTVVISHGIVDPGPLYSGELPHAAAMINEPVRRWRVTGTDLLPAFAQAAPIDVYGIGAGELDPSAVGPRVHGITDLDQAFLHREVARRRVYLHTARWTSLGLSLLEAMHLGMPVVALAATEAVTAVPPDAGAISTDVVALTKALGELVHEPDLAALAGKEFALAHYGLDAFLRAWDSLLAAVVR
jgi:hypothetical protein